MPNNYKGTFWGLDEKQYEVLIIGDSGSTSYTEVLLSDTEPFIVRYETSTTPFDPVRKSTATINVVRDDYMEDILSCKAHGTIVKLQEVSGDTRTTLWCGWLTPKVYDAGYEECFEEYSLECADCISSLQYFEYQKENVSPGLVTFQQLLAQITDACELLTGFYWPRSKCYGNVPSDPIHPKQLVISERNFFSSDIEEPWKLSEVLEEICKYVGATAIQWGTDLYLVDYQWLQNAEAIYVDYHRRSNGYAQPSNGTQLGGVEYINGDSYRQNGATISFEPVYNKAVVRQNLYAVEHFLPGLFDDRYLHNRLDDTTTDENFYASLEVTPLTTPGVFPSGGGWLLGMNQDYDYESDEYGKRDQDFVYRMRLYDHDWYDPVFTNHNGNSVTPTTAQMKSTGITADYRGANIVDLGVVQRPSRNSQAQLVVPSKMDYTRYLCIFEWHDNYTAGSGNQGKSWGDGKTVFKLKDGFRSDVITGKDCFIVINFSLLFERYKDRNYINPEWTDQHCSQPWSKPGSSGNFPGSVRFRLQIGSKYWNGSTWTNTSSTFSVPAEWDKVAKNMFTNENGDFWNTDLQVLNNVSWEDELNCQGYKIPLDGVDLSSQQVHFDVINPTKSVWGNTGSNSFENYMMQYNAYCWVKDFTIDFVRKGNEGQTENDVVFENVITSGSTLQLGDITLKITSDTELAPPSYSTVCYQRTAGDTPEPLSGVTEYNIDGVERLPEENIIEKYVRQYRTPTAKITLTVSDDGITPFTKLFGVDADDSTQGFVQLGTEIDYHNSRQTMVCVEKKNVAEND